MRYLVTAPWYLRMFWPSFTWRVKTTEKVIYLTFDDGPHPEATSFVLDELQRANARATFFCIGKNVVKHPGIYDRIIAEGHRTGNHTHHHLNGWKSKSADYLQSIKEAAGHIESDLFRPPYGRIRLSQSRIIKRDYRIVMWSVLSADFDTSLNGRRCGQHVIRNAGHGSIVVFHDSEKAFPRMVEALPMVLNHFGKKGYRFEHL